MADIKPPSIKPDPDAPGASPLAFEDDIYEDAGDLEFNTDPNFQRVYLARVPRELWEAWSHLDEDAEIHIGTVRMELKPQPNGGESKQALSMLLDSSIAQHQLVPKEYSLDISADNVNNTFVFTEQDLPGFKSKSRTAFDASTANMPARYNRAKPDKEKPFPKQPYDPNRRFQPYFKKAIPKRTTLAAKVAHEVSCIAVDNPESRRILAQRTMDAMRPKVKTKFINHDTSAVDSGFIHAGTIGATNTFGGFIRTKGQAAGAKPQTQKAARMPQNELLDRLFTCFRKYKYWSMKALRAELQQPEAYLRETLEKIAVLAKSGRFATQWSLKPENMPEYYAADEEESSAPTMGLDGADDSDMADMDDDDEDEDVKFEDVA